MTKIDGVINIYKPQEYTSRDCVNIVRKATGIKKIGHTGTLDPMATGVLPICIGNATKGIQYFDLDLKEYICTVRLGQISDTLDIWGKVENTNVSESVLEKALEEKNIADILKQFKGGIEQVPPKYSALKVDGRRLYDYARAGETVEIKSRKIYIEDIQLLKINLDDYSFDFKVICGKGTYIRSICRDIGEKLSTGALMVALERVKTGAFKIEESISIETIKKWIREDVGLQNIENRIEKLDLHLNKLGKLKIKKEKEKYFLNGGKISVKDMEILKKSDFIQEQEGKNSGEHQIYSIYNVENDFLGTGYFDKKIGAYRPHKIF